MNRQLLSGQQRYFIADYIAGGDERASFGRRYFREIKSVLSEMRQTRSLEDVEAFIRNAKGLGYFREGSAWWNTDFT